MFHFQRNAKNRSRDLAALTLLLSIPILLLITAFYAVAAWNADSLNNPNNPHYVAPVLRSASSLSACLAPATTQIPDFTSTRLHMPMVLPLRVGYLTSLATLSGYVGELTIWGIIPTSACTPNAAALPSPNVNITHGSGVMGYSYTTTKASTFVATCYLTSRDGGTGWVGYRLKTWKETVEALCYATTIWPGGDEKMSTKHNRYPLTSAFGNFVVMGEAVASTAVPVAEPAPLPTAPPAPAATITGTPKVTGDIHGTRPAGVEIWTEGASVTRTIYMVK